nr:Gag-Pol polyprotein [Tanacetum cinerariifolium]
MFTLTVSTAKLKNIKEEMVDSAWIKTMQEKFYQFERLQLWELVEKPFGKIVIKLKWLWKNKKDKDQTVIRNKARLVAKGYAQEEGHQIHQSPRGIFINQAKYALEILKKHGMDKCDSIGTPMATKPKLDADLIGLPEEMVDSAWIKTMQEKFYQFERLQLWELVEKPFGKIVIKLKWLWKNKKDKDQTVIRNKARLVAKGYAQEEVTMEILPESSSNKLCGRDNRRPLNRDSSFKNSVLSNTNKSSKKVEVSDRTNKKTDVASTNIVLNKKIVTDVDVKNALKAKNVNAGAVRLQQEFLQLPRPMYEEYFKKRSCEVSINSATQQVYNNKDSPSTSLIIVETRGSSHLTVNTFEPKNMKEAMSDHSWIESMQDELHQFKRLDVWELVPRPDRKKWLRKNKNDAKNIVIRNKSHLVTKGYKQEESIDFVESGALVALLEAVRMFVAYATYKNFTIF